jgi:hypothetical protein
MTQYIRYAIEKSQVFEKDKIRSSNTCPKGCPKIWTLSYAISIRLPFEQNKEMQE